MKNSFYMVKNFFGSLLILSIAVLVSCNKEEGTGGEGSIKGVVFIKEYLTSGNVFIRQIPASDEDVFILYGSNTSVGDKVATSNDGTFEFSNLRDGSYKIYAYSDDSLYTKDNNQAIMVDVKISSGNAIKVDTLFISKYIDKLDGTGQITGFVYRKNYDQKTIKLQNILPAADEDVYLSLTTNNYVIDRVRASFDGRYIFYEIPDGKYNIYVYSSDTSNNTKTIVKSQAIDILHGNIVIIDTLFTLKLNEGLGQITGKLFIKEYDKNFKYFQRIVPASSEDVYLCYSNDSVELSRVRTSYDGSYSFDKLSDGNYKIYVYQDDTAMVLKKTSVISPVISIAQGCKVNAADLYAFKGIDIDEGNSTISGKITLINYKTLYTIKDIGNAQDYDVFLVYGNHTTYEMDTKTDNNGVFTFSNLIKGDYIVYVYTEQEDEFGNLTGTTEKIIHEKHISITTDKQEFFITDTVKKQ
jgi:hypothetical protein